MMWFHKDPLVLRYVNAIFQSVFHRLKQNLFTCNVLNLVFIICSLLVGIDCVTDKSKVEWKLPFFNLVPRVAESRILGLWNFTIFWGNTPLDPLPHPRIRGRTSPCWYTGLLYSNLLATSIYIETPCFCGLLACPELFCDWSEHDNDTLK